MGIIILDIALAVILVYSVVDKIVRDKNEEKRRKRKNKNKVTQVKG
jgi:hypothetical protein